MFKVHSFGRGVYVCVCVCVGGGGGGGGGCMWYSGRNVGPHSLGREELEEYSSIERGAGVGAR